MITPGARFLTVREGRYKYNTEKEWKDPSSFGSELEIGEYELQITA